MSEVIILFVWIFHQLHSDLKQKIQIAAVEINPVILWCWCRDDSQIEFFGKIAEHENLLS